MDKAVSKSTSVARLTVGGVLAILVAVSATFHSKTSISTKTTVAKVGGDTVIMAGIKQFYPPTPAGLSFS